MKTIAVIPARYASTRFPAKPLALLDGKPLIQWVWERVTGSDLFSEVIVATDSPLIQRVCAAFGARAAITREDHPSGTDRVAEVVARQDADFIINIQGDEPFITTRALQDLDIACFKPNFRMASLMTKLNNEHELQDPNIVKVVVDKQCNALYFSRSIIPFNRDKAPFNNYWRHIGVYAYSREALLEFVSLPPSELEQVEKLEQLRALENGIPIRMVKTDYQGIGVDTPQDLEKLEKSLREKKL